MAISFAILPRTHWQRLRLGLALLLLAGVLFWFRPDRYWWHALSAKQEGDILCPW